ncbi:MAG: phosphate ABC transporter permease PstA, partial [Proteobacteria bacterium]|nr:phosphate ABC transporter permease PstA [Pseudomonadota bacterium]
MNGPDNMSASVRVHAGLAARYRRERRFKLFGLAAIVASLLFLVVLLGSIVAKGYTAFWQTQILLDIHFDPQVLDVNNLATANYGSLVREATRALFPQAASRQDQRTVAKLVSTGAAYQLQEMVMAKPELIGSTRPLWVLADDEVDMFVKGHISRDVPEHERRISDQQAAWIDQLTGAGRLRQTFNSTFFQAGDSREPELAGIQGAVVGSFLTLIVTLTLSFPIGVAAAVYLEEFAPKNRWIDLIEVNINNLAAIPSIVFGLLGLAVFLNYMGLPRSTSLVGGLVLTLMTLPTIIIASRASLQSVPPSIREAALGIGASQVQTVVHHVLPLAMPGMMTGAIIGMARALGETAPLLMIGMVAFIVDVPHGFSDPATVLPVQIYLWAGSPERAFVERTAAAIMVLLLLLLTMNAAAVLLRNKFERR